MQCDVCIGVVAWFYQPNVASRAPLQKVSEGVWSTLRGESAERAAWVAKNSGAPPDVIMELTRHKESPLASQEEFQDVAGPGADTVRLGTTLVAVPVPEPQVVAIACMCVFLCACVGKVVTEGSPAPIPHPSG